jgi:NAD(P)-dependent dehydrogenase (short-subunit alcohol dehydrogenase family)
MRRRSPRFPQQAVLITGAATGIGRAVAVGFASRGARVAVGDINEEAAHETLDLVRQAGGEVLFVRTNVSVEGDVEKLVAATVERFGKLDCALGADVSHFPDLHVRRHQQLSVHRMNAS